MYTRKDSLLSENEKATAQIPELTTAEAQMKFAKLLSQAASNSVEVRKFLKNEATKQFDNDYDVFYPMVKTKLLLTARVSKIFYSLTANPEWANRDWTVSVAPKYPDSGLDTLWDFNAKKWDVNDKEVVVLCRDDERDTMYETEKTSGKWQKEMFPVFPA